MNLSHYFTDFAAVMLASYATGRLNGKDPVLAYEHELIANKIDSRR